MPGMTAAQPSAGPVPTALLKALRLFELELRPMHLAARALPALMARTSMRDRPRVVERLRRGDPLEPSWPVLPPAPSVVAELRRLDHLRRRCEDLPVDGLYGRRLAELELELCMLSELGRPKAVRPLAARRYGDGSVHVPLGDQQVPVARIARRILERVEGETEAPSLPAEAGRGELSLKELLLSVADEAGLSVRVVVEPRLLAGAAAGDRTVFIAKRDFGPREAARLCVHEMLGHLTAAANGRAQPLRLLEWGTADSFTDQEGLCLCLEDRFGVLDPSRLRTLAARVVATDAMHEGATFTETARTLLGHGVDAPSSVTVTERAFRGGGVARDVAYLVGFLRVLDATSRGTADLQMLRAGRLSLSALQFVPHLVPLGLCRAPAYRPNFARSFFSTRLGTTPFKFPPNAAASLIRDELK